MPMFGRGKPREMSEEQKAEFLEKRKAELAEKLEKGEITEDEYKKQIEALENGKMPMFGRGKPEEMSEEQKAEFSEKRKNNVDKGHFPMRKGKKMK